MARKESSLVGIDLHEQEIRVVEINCRNNKPSLGKIGRAPMPDGSVVNGRVMHPGPVAVALRLLMNSMGIGATAHAVIGVLGDGTALRTMSVPPVPDAELPAIIAGEVNHHGLIRSAGGAYSYLRLNPHPRTSSPEANISGRGAEKRETWLDPDASDQNPAVVTVVAVEEDVLYSLRETCELANLTIEAIEPSQYAMYRSIMYSAGAGATLFALMVSPANTDVAFVHKGLIVGYRRIDIGSRLLTLEYGTSADSSGASSAGLGMGFEPYNRGNSTTGPDNLNRLAVENLSLEVQRTLNFYQREFPDVNIEDHVYLSVDDARIEDVARELTLGLGVSIEPVHPSTTTQDNPDAPVDSGSSLSTIYSASFGLAMHGQPIMGRVPRIDLYTKQRAGVQQAETQRNFKGSIITSLLAILLGSVGYFLYSKQITTLEAETNSTKAKTNEIAGRIDQKEADRHTKQEQFKALRTEGVPVVEIMDSIASSVSSGTGLDSVVVLPDLKVAMQFRSVNEQLMINTLQTLQKSQIVTDLQINRFGELTTEQGVGVGFEIDGKAISAGRIRLPEEVKK